MKIAVYNLKGSRAGEMNLDERLFGAAKNDDLIHQVYVSIAGNKRRALAHTKSRSQRAGSTRKPWKQKGTGRARTGSVRNPIWRKGGVTFGPTNERNYAKKINKKMARAAFGMVLSDKIQEKKVFVVESFDSKENKTKEFDGFLKKLKIEKKTVVGFLPAEKQAMRMSKNIPGVSNVSIERFSVGDILDNKNCVCSKQGIAQLQARIIGEKSKQALSGAKKEVQKTEKTKRVTKTKKTKN